ncbi:MAG: UPF0016 family membrane protein [Acidimicrobiales bacterium]|nr:MAG: UPF0016 family membrane protein [Acidimicrobiales bacterium]
MSELLSAAAVVFLAELGDKTQLLALGLGARHRLLPTFLGVVAAYAMTNALSAVVGGVLGAALPTRWIGVAGGLLFLAFAFWTLRGERGESRSGEGEDVGAGAGEPGGARASAGVVGVVVSVAAAMFVAELGDKTMLATATLASRGSPVLVWAGATLGICASGGSAVALGHFGGRTLPERVVRIGSALLFALFGVLMVIGSV